jgi:hypothetical protein
MSKTKLIFVGLSVVLIATLIGLLFVLRDIPLAAVTAFLGVLLGGSIAGFIQYWISELDRDQQLRLAALDRRLQAHQESYTLWRKLLFADKRNEEVHNVVEECQEWWESNCIFLTSEAREAFLKAYLSASDHSRFLAAHDDAELIKMTWNDVIRAGDIILRGVRLPSLSGLEEKRVNDRQNTSDA